VQKAIWKRWFSFALFGLMLCLRGLPAKAEDGRPPEPAVTVAVHNHAGLSASMLAQAERMAGTIFRQAGVEVVWVNCDLPVEEGQIASSCHVTEFPRHLQLSIARRSKDLTESVLGVSFLAEDGSGCYSDVFLGPAEELHEKLHVINVGTLLGHVAAHEIGHLLLGTNSHSDAGIMRPHWDERDLAKASKGELHFTQAQGQTMRARVAASLCRNERVVIATASGRN
jgi:hypothetical protein